MGAHQSRVRVPVESEVAPHRGIDHRVRSLPAAPEVPGPLLDLPPYPPGPGIHRRDGPAQLREARVGAQVRTGVLNDLDQSTTSRPYANAAVLVP